MERTSSEGFSPKLLDTEQVARALGVTRDTLAEWRRSDIALPYVRIGRRVFYRVEDLERLLITHLKDVDPKRADAARDRVHRHLGRVLDAIAREGVGTERGKLSAFIRFRAGA